MASVSRGSTRSPFSQLPMMSTGPPFSVATRGSPLAAASSRVRPKGSVSAGFTKTPREALASR